MLSNKIDQSSTRTVNNTVLTSVPEVFLAASPLVPAAFGRRSEAKYFRPPRAKKNLLYPGYVLFAGDTNLSSSVDCHTQYLNKKTRRVTTHGKQTLKSNHHEFSLFQGFTIIFIISIFTVKIS